MQQTISTLGRELSDATLRLHQVIAERAGLTGTDHKYLGILTRYGPMTAGELGRHSGLTSGAVTGLVDRLEEKQLVSRQPSPDDRRKVLIVPKPANIKKLLGRTSAELERRIVSHVSAMPKRDVAVVEKYLREMIVILHELSEKFQATEAVPAASKSTKEGC